MSARSAVSGDRRCDARYVPNFEQSNAAGMVIDGLRLSALGSTSTTDHRHASMSAALNLETVASIT